MKYNFSIPQQPETVIEVDISLWTGKQNVWVNGHPAKQSGQSKRRKPQFLIPDSTGTEKTLELKPSLFGELTAFLSGEKIQVTPPLTWYQYIFGGFPILLIFLGGAIGGFFGILGSIINYSILRSNFNLAVKILAVIGVSAISLLLYLLSVFTITSALKL
ncbi:hypothetical protein FRZ06_13705 [Anoxybacterium hadale]|uniref:Uncharacterized protein n=1 Tax=Anoxybacterium hadale TaxID=3408580 RepID=A0ACD1ACV6_9FIRM|nr:hypothetical protein FRZ06_13705 [Clostridiales bacterium]